MATLTTLAGRSFRKGTFPLVPAVALLFATVLSETGSFADQDVYSALPPDASVVQFGLGDLAGDPAEELALLFTSQGAARLAVFAARDGRWSLLLEGPSPSLGLEAGTPRCLELADANGDGRDEILTHSLSAGEGAMITRILAVGEDGGKPPSLDVLLEEMTSPPGYPLFGTERGVPSVTFLKMPSPKAEPGHRRAYCWEAGRFEKCVEVLWGKP